MNYSKWQPSLALYKSEFGFSNCYNFLISDFDQAGGRLDYDCLVRIHLLCMLPSPTVETTVNKTGRRL